MCDAFGAVRVLVCVLWRRIVQGPALLLFSIGPIDFKNVPFLFFSPVIRNFVFFLSSLTNESRRRYERITVIKKAKKFGWPAMTEWNTFGNYYPLSVSYDFFFQFSENCVLTFTIFHTIQHNNITGQIMVIIN